MKISVAAWNMAYWSHKNLHDEAWDYLLNTLSADFYLVQESKRPTNLESDKNFLWHCAGETRGRKEWGTGTYSSKYQVTKEPDNSISSWDKNIFEELCVVANARVNNDLELTLISLYGRIDKISYTGYSIANLHRALSDLTGILNNHYGKRNVILGGDLNASKQMDPQQRNNSHRLFFDRLEDFGLKSVFELNKNPDFVRTLRHHSSKVDWQNDYVYLSKNIVTSFISCEVIENDEVMRFSDHNPVLVTLDI